MLHWTIEKIVLPLRYTWKIARNSSECKTNFLIHVKNNNSLGTGEVAPNSRYQESADSILAEFATLLNHGLPQIRDVKQLESLCAKYTISNALKCGLESAFLDAQAQHLSVLLSERLQIKSFQSRETLYTVPILEPDDLVPFINEHKLSRFKMLKLKVNEELANDIVDNYIAYSDLPFVIDGNETWSNPEDFLSLTEKWYSKNYPIQFIEQPLPAYQTEDYMMLKKLCPFEIFADESILSNPDFSALKKQFHGVNIKLMKCGGVIEAIKQIRQAKLFGLKTMLGCMVETSIGISMAALLSAEVDFIDLDSFLYLESDPYHWVQEVNGQLILNY